MARALSGVARLAASLSENITVSVSRRGHATASAATGEKNAVAGKVIESSSSSSSASSNSWVPDPVTGYYRPGNQRVQMDAAELREMFLSSKN